MLGILEVVGPSDISAAVDAVAQAESRLRTLLVNPDFGITGPAVERGPGRFLGNVQSLAMSTGRAVEILAYATRSEPDRMASDFPHISVRELGAGVSHVQHARDLLLADGPGDDLAYAPSVVARVAVTLNAAAQYFERGLHGPHGDSIEPSLSFVAEIEPDVIDLTDDGDKLQAMRGESADEFDGFAWIDSDDDFRIVEIERAILAVLAALDAKEYAVLHRKIGSWKRSFRVWTRTRGRVEVEKLRRAAELQLLDRTAGRVTGDLAAALAQLAESLKGQRALVVFKDFVFQSDVGADGIWQVLWRPLSIAELRAIEADPTLTWDQRRLERVLGLDATTVGSH